MSRPKGPLVLVLLQRVVPHQHLRVGLAEMLRELLGNVNGTMPAPCATDRNGQITAIRLRELAHALLRNAVKSATMLRTLAKPAR